MRVLVTGLSTHWGGRVAQAIERRPDVEVVVGVDTRDPRIPLDRTEFVRSDSTHSILARIVQAAQVDTIVHSHLIVDSTRVSGRSLHEINVIGTMNLFAAASAAGSTVRNVVVKSSTLVYGCSAEDPTWFTEDLASTKPPQGPIERSLDQVESYVRDFAEDNPHVNVSLLRFANVIGQEIVTPLTRALGMPMVPSVLGFDPRFQFVHEDDVIRSILYVLSNNLAGIYNVAGDGLLPWSEVARICGKRTFPLPPFFNASLLRSALKAALVDLPDEYLTLLRYGRGVDNRRLKATGFDYEYTSAQAVKAFIEASRLRGAVGTNRATYRYERDVEQFFRHSPAIVRES